MRLKKMCVITALACRSLILLLLFLLFSGSTKLSPSPLHLSVVIFLLFLLFTHTSGDFIITVLPRLSLIHIFIFLFFYAVVSCPSLHPIHLILNNSSPHPNYHVIALRCSLPHSSVPLHDMYSPLSSCFSPPTPSFLCTF